MAPARHSKFRRWTFDGPRAGEVLVEIKERASVTTDEFTRSGADPEGLFP